MHILVNAGPTREYFDTVRFISNPSSGKMGFAIAAQAAHRGHQVHLVAGPVDLPDPPGVTVTRVVSAAEMLDACVSAFARCDAAIMTAAVCDYRPEVKLDRKLKKSAAVREIRLMPTEDICATLGRTRQHRVVIGFAMEDHDEQAYAEAKLERKGCDAIVLNGLANVGSDRAVVQILRADAGWSEPIKGTKHEIADRVVELAEELVGKPVRGV